MSKFLNMKVAEEHRNCEMSKAQSYWPKRISWDCFDLAWSLGSLEESITVILEAQSDTMLYIGAAASPLLRWDLCDGHDLCEGSPMAAHRFKYDFMFVLMVDWGAVVHVVGEQLTTKLHSSRKLKARIANNVTYRAGPCGRVMFLYVCTRS